MEMFELLKSKFPHYHSGNTLLLNADCLDVLALLPDKAFDLAIVDPPYGIKASRPSDKSKFVKQKNGTSIFMSDSAYVHKDWDDEIADDSYFDELIRMSKEQIIWGVNFYPRVFGKGRLVWDKLNDYSDQHDCEIAYCSINERVDIVRFMWAGFMQGLRISKSIKDANIQQGNKSLNEKLIHPTQKPIKLYEWLLINYAKPNQIVLDTHLGSGSSSIASHYFGCTFVGIELDTDYFNAAVNRFRNETSQVDLLMEFG